MKRITAVLISLMLMLACTAVAYANTGTVYNGTLDDYGNYKLGKMFDAYFTNASWLQGVGADGYTYVSITGDTTYNNRPTQVSIQFRMLGDSRFEVCAFERDGKGRAWSEFHSLMTAICQYYDTIQANLAYQKPSPTPTPDNSCPWCDEWWCEGNYCEKTDSWRDVVPGEHSFWGITSGETTYPGDILDEKGIQYEEISGSRLSQIHSLKDQEILLFGLPVSLSFQYSASRPNWLTHIDIDCRTSDAADALDAFITLLKATAAQYGEPTGGYMQTGSYYWGDEWSFPIDDMEIFEETIFTALTEEKYVMMCLYNKNLGVYVSLAQKDDTIVGNTWLRYHYNLPAALEEAPPDSADFFTFARPRGVYGATPKTITIGF